MSLPALVEAWTESILSNWRECGLVYPDEIDSSYSRSRKLARAAAELCACDIYAAKIKNDLAGMGLTPFDTDTLVSCTCGHRKDSHCNGIEYCKQYPCGPPSCQAFTFRSPEDRTKWEEANANI